MTLKVALVTGGASGIGRATAVKFAEEGCQVILVDRNTRDGEAVAGKLRDEGLSAAFFECDVTDLSAVEALFEDVNERFGRLDYAVNAVGGGIAGAEAPIEQIAPENWQRELDLNLKSTFACLQQEIRLMKRAGTGSIVNVSSIAGLGGSGSNPAYTAGKHAVIGLTKQAAIENGPYGIRVNAVCPGAVLTPMLVESFGGNDDFMERLAATNVLGRVANPVEIAEPVYWLCSSKASFITGAVLVADGGTTASAVNVASNRQDANSIE